MQRIGWMSVVVFLAGGPTGAAVAGSTVHVGTQYPAGALISLDRIDHAVWDRLVKTYVDPDGFVDYAAWKGSSADMAALDQYLDTLSRGDPRTTVSPSDVLAFWINAYNAVTVRGILREYPTTSIRNHTARVWGYNIWQDLLLWVGNQAYSLETIEHKILRKLGEPRIHFAIVCASIGCPRLRNEAYVTDRLEAQLAGNTRDFFARNKHFKVDFARRTVYVSSILKWFGEDFGSSPQKGLASLAEYLPNGAVRRLIQARDVRIEYLDYDWGLNEKRTVSGK